MFLGFCQNFLEVLNPEPFGDVKISSFQIFGIKRSLSQGIPLPDIIILDKLIISDVYNK